MKFEFILSPVAALLFTYILIPVFRKLALKIQLVDKPNKRKVHHIPVPLIGGVSISIATTLALMLSLPLDLEVYKYKNVFIAPFILLLMGLIDDKVDLRASVKLSIQLILAHFVFEQGIKIESLHGLMGIYDLAPWAQYIFTVVVVTGVVNAFNLMDGIDGLAAGIAILGFIVFGILSFITGQMMMALVFFTLIGSLISFLRFNLSKHQKIFMGDAGSIVIGFVLVVSSISLLQASRGNEHHSLVILGVISVLFVPVADSLRVYRRRAKSGKSPFSADKTHLHHLILSAGLQHKRTTLLILAIISLLMVLGFLGFNLLGLTFSILLMFLVFFALTRAFKFNNQLNHWKNHIKTLENKIFHS